MWYKIKNKIISFQNKFIVQKITGTQVSNKIRNLTNQKRLLFVRYFKVSTASLNHSCIWFCPLALTAELSNAMLGGVCSLLGTQQNSEFTA